MSLFGGMSYELKLDVVGVPEDENGPVRFVGYRRLRQRARRLRRRHHAVCREVVPPALQLCPARDDETHMIQPRPHLGESFRLVGLMAVKNDNEGPLLVCQHQPDATRMWRLHQRRHIENLLIPS